MNKKSFWTVDFLPRFVATLIISVPFGFCFFEGVGWRFFVVFYGFASWWIVGGLLKETGRV